jgi:endonuclease V-like protein UPF0215 family
LLKKEVRILGLSAAPPVETKVPVVGVVFRGNLWLDGVLTLLLRTNQSDYHLTLARAIIESKQYSQLQAVILSRDQFIPGALCDIESLARRIKLPVIAIIKPGQSDRQSKSHSSGRSQSQLRLDLRSRHFSLRCSGMNAKRCRDIFLASLVENGRIPEAVRVADLIAKNVRRTFSFQDD